MVEIFRVVLLLLEVLASILLIGVILIQKSKGGGLSGAAFGSGMGESLFGARAGNVLTRITIILSVFFLANTLLLAFMFASPGDPSLMDRVGGRAGEIRVIEPNAPSPEDPAASRPPDPSALGAEPVQVPALDPLAPDLPDGGGAAVEEETVRLPLPGPASATGETGAAPDAESFVEPEIRVTLPLESPTPVEPRVAGATDERAASPDDGSADAPNPILAPAVSPSVAAEEAAVAEEADAPPPEEAEPAPASPGPESVSAALESAEQTGTEPEAIIAPVDETGSPLEPAPTPAPPAPDLDPIAPSSEEPDNAISSVKESASPSELESAVVSPTPDVESATPDTAEPPAAEPPAAELPAAESPAAEPPAAESPAAEPKEIGAPAEEAAPAEEPSPATDSEPVPSEATPPAADPVEAAAPPEEEGSSVESVPRAAVSSAPETEPEGRLEVADPSEDMALAEDVQVNANPPVAQAPQQRPKRFCPNLPRRILNPKWNCRLTRPQERLFLPRSRRRILPDHPDRAPTMGIRLPNSAGGAAVDARSRTRSSVSC